MRIVRKQFGNFFIKHRYRLILANLFLYCSTTFSSSVIPMNLEELIDKSDSIVIGHFISKHAYWENEKIFTDHVLIPNDTIKGTEQAQYNIKTLGGVAPHPRLNTPVLMSVSGEASLENGANYVLFIAKGSDDNGQIVGLNQGVFVIQSDEVTGEQVIAVGRKKLIKQDSSQKSSGSLFSLELSDFSLEPIQMTLEEFKEEIEQYLGAREE